MTEGESAPTYRSGTSSVPADGGSATPAERAAALAFLQQLATELSERKVDLPCFSTAVVRISEALVDPSTTADQVVTIVGTEPTLAARLLQTANSAAFTAGGKPVADLRAAVIRIGMQMVQSIAISYAIKQMQYEEALRAVQDPLQALWQKSIATACICQLVAERTKVQAPAAFLTGLLHGIGALYIMAHAALRSTDPDTRRFTLEMLDGWQASVGKAVLECWGFAEPICDAVAGQNDLDRRWQHEASLTDVLIVSLVLVDARKQTESREFPIADIGAFASVGFTATDCEATLLRADRRIDLMHAALS